VDHISESELGESMFAGFEYNIKGILIFLKSVKGKTHNCPQNFKVMRIVGLNLDAHID